MITECTRPLRIAHNALPLDYAGVYSFFLLLFAKCTETNYRIPAREILVELGRRGMVGGQEDMIEDPAMTRANAVLPPPERAFGSTRAKDVRKVADRLAVDVTQAAHIEGAGSRILSVLQRCLLVSIDDRQRASLLCQILAGPSIVEDVVVEYLNRGDKLTTLNHQFEGTATWAVVPAELFYYCCVSDSTHFCSVRLLLDSCGYIQRNAQR